MFKYKIIILFLICTCAWLIPSGRLQASENPATVVRIQKIDSVKRAERVSHDLFRRVFGDKKVAEIQLDLIKYGNGHLPPFVSGYFARFVQKAGSYPIILLFAFLIVVFVINIFLVILVLYFTNQQKNHKERYIRVYQNIYEEVLRLYFFGEIRWETALIKLKKIKRPLNRKILTSVLLNFQENLRGGMDNQVLKVFEDLKLYKDSLRSTRSMFFYRRVEGLRELTKLYPKGAGDTIERFLNNPHHLVRAEAQTSIIRLHPEEPFGFLRKLTSPFTRWTQVTAFYLFRIWQLNIPSFSDYLDSENPNVRNFCLRMIIFFQQLENATAIFQLIGSQSETTRWLTYRAINDLRLYDGKQQIKDKYSKETNRNRIEIIRAFRNIGAPEDCDFLENILLTGSVTLKTEACRSLYYMNDEGPERLAILNANSELKIEQYIAHVTDLRN